MKNTTLNTSDYIPVEIPEAAASENGQTSDQQAALIGEIAELPADYEWDDKPKSIKEFFTCNDYLFLIRDTERQFEEYKSILQERLDGYSAFGSCFSKTYKKQGFSIWPKFKDIGAAELYPEPELHFSCFGGVDYSYSNFIKTLSEFKNMPYETARDIFFGKCRLYDFSDVSKVPAGVSEMFVLTCESIDKKKSEIEDNFVLIALYLSDLDGMDSSNFSSYGCKNIYDFSEQRFGFGRTSTKNFIAIRKKFIENTVIKEGYRDFSYSQLTELVSVDEKLLPEFNPRMTIKEIRAKKKELIGGGVSVGTDDKSSKLAREVKSSKLFSYEEISKMLSDLGNPYRKDDRENQSPSCIAYDRAINDVKMLFFK